MNHSPVTVSTEEAASMLVDEVIAGRITPAEADDQQRCMAREALMQLLDRDTLRACDLAKPDALDHLDAALRERVLRTMEMFNHFAAALGRRLRAAGLVGNDPGLN